MTETPKPLLCVHQGSELYGSDRVFLQSVRAFRQAYPELKITVHLPTKGPLSDLLTQEADEVVIDKMFVLRRAYCKPKYWRHLLDLPRCLKTAWRQLRLHDTIYLSTATLAGYLLLLRFSRKKAVLHVHEYLNGPSGWFLRLLILFSGAKIIANSQAVADRIGKGARVVWNGVADTQAPPKEETAQTARPLRFLLLGRINRWKGQLLAVEAVKQLRDDGIKDIRLDIVGDVFEDQKHFLTEITEKVREDKLESHVFFHGFTTDPGPMLRQTHVVLVPSTEPEPFGLVAIEAMREALPVIAANHGGLREIVVNNETGFLVQPASAAALAEAMRKYYVHESLREKHGVSGRKRYHELFTEERYVKRFIQAAYQCGLFSNT